MTEENKSLQELDWEFSEDFYREAEHKKEMKLADFIGEELSEQQKDEPKLQSETFAKVVEEVKAVLEMSRQGKNIEAIAEAQGLDQGYVYNILANAQGFSEDDPVSVAHLVMMG